VLRFLVCVLARTGDSMTRGALVETEVRTPRPGKVAVVEEVRDRLGRADATILTEYRGLSVAQLQLLRRALAPAGGEYKVYKNTLVRRAAKESGLEELAAILTGPTALAFVTGDVSAVAKALKDFARQHPSLVVKGAVVGGGLFDAAQTSAIADLPSRDILLAQIAGALAAPMQRFASLLAAVPQKFAYALSALIEERGGAPTPEAAEVPTSEAPGEPSEPGAAGDAASAEPPVAEEAVTAGGSAEVAADGGTPAEEAAGGTSETAGETARAEGEDDQPADAADTPD
jgi:large subunit ribosomal protein L10